MRLMRFLYLVLMMFAYSQVQAGTIDTHGQAAYEQCGYCHEYDGNSVMPDYPRLAGQNKHYLMKQLYDFKTAKRKGLMQATAELLTKQDIESVASYFSQQAMSGIRANSQLSNHELARKLYFQGDEKRNLPACTTCHGQISTDDTPVPKLSGQHSKYLIGQLLLFKSGKRSNDNNRVMRDIAEKLTLSEMTELAEFLSVQGPSRPNNIENKP